MFSLGLIIVGTLGLALASSGSEDDGSHSRSFMDWARNLKNKEYSPGDGQLFLQGILQLNNYFDVKEIYLVRSKDGLFLSLMGAQESPGLSKKVLLHVKNIMGSSEPGRSLLAERDSTLGERSLEEYQRTLRLKESAYHKESLPSWFMTALGSDLGNKIKIGPIALDGSFDILVNKKATRELSRTDLLSDIADRLNETKPSSVPLLMVSHGLVRDPWKLEKYMTGDTDNPVIHVAGVTAFSCNREPVPVLR